MMILADNVKKVMDILLGICELQISKDLLNFLHRIFAFLLNLS